MKIALVLVVKLLLAAMVCVAGCSRKSITYAPRTMPKCTDRNDGSIYVDAQGTIWVCEYAREDSPWAISNVNSK